MMSPTFGGQGGRRTGPRLVGAAVGGFGAHHGFAGDWNSGGWNIGGGGLRGGWDRGWDWDDWGGGWGWDAALADLAVGLTFGPPYWDPWYYGGYGYGGYWGPDYGYWDGDYWTPDYVGYWDEPYDAGWELGGNDYGYYWRPRLWRSDRRPIIRVSYDYAQPAFYQAALAYDVPIDCGGEHYVWDDYVGGYVFRRYFFPC